MSFPLEKPRGKAPLDKLGICQFPSPYSLSEIDELNAALNPLLAERSEAKRAYVRVDELQKLGLFDRFFSPSMLNILFSIMPDPVLYHCHVYEIAANDTQSHIFSEKLSGWHRDQDSELVANETTHVSVFVYLSDVGQDDGPFEFVPTTGNSWLHARKPKISVTGPPGYTFAWQRSFYHRASPNRGPTRRRLFKISIQRNRFPSVHLGNPYFKELIACVPPGRPSTDILLGRFQGADAPAIEGIVGPPQTAIPTNGHLGISNKDLLNRQLRDRARGMKEFLKGGAQVPKNVPYD